MSLVQMLNEILSGYSDVRISQMTGIERTRLSRIKKGKFKIEYSELKKIIAALAIDEDTAKKLSEAFLLEKYGKDKYNSLIMAKDFLSSLHYDGLSSDGAFTKDALKARYSVDFDIPKDIVVLDNIVSVRNAVSMILIKAHSDGQKIRVISSPFSEYLLSMVYAITASAPNLEIEHIYSLSSVNELSEPSTYYMSVASAIYPIFMLNTNYRAFYSLVGHETNSLMPFNIITDKFSFLVDHTGKSAVLVKDPDVIKLHKRLFDERRRICTSFINKINTTEDYFTHYCTIMEKTSMIYDGVYYSIDYEPCVLSYLTEDELKKCFTYFADNETVLGLLKRFIDNFSTFKSNKQISFFTKKGLRSFVETGTIMEIPENIGLVLPPKRRREVLEQVLEKMKDDKSQKVYYLVNEKELDLPLGLRFLGSGTKADHLFVISETHEGVRSILSLTNPDIVSAVFTFVESMPESSMVYPRDEMIAYMEKTISEMPG